MVSDESLEGLGIRGGWTEQSTVPQEVYHQSDGPKDKRFVPQPRIESMSYSVVDPKNRGPSAVMAMTAEEKRIRVKDICLRDGHFYNDNEKFNAIALNLMKELNTCGACQQARGEALWRKSLVSPLTSKER